MTVGLLRHYIVQPLTAHFQGHWESRSQSCPTESVVQWRTRSARWVAVTVVVSRHAGPFPDRGRLGRDPWGVQGAVNARAATVLCGVGAPRRFAPDAARTTYDRFRNWGWAARSSR